MAEVPINGAVLEWARNLRGFSIESAAQKLGVSVDELRAYETGRRKPLIGFLRKVAAKYRVSFASLLMPEPLPAVERPTDHRTRPQANPLSVDTLVAIEEVGDALETFKDIADEYPHLVPRLRIGTATLHENPEAVAIRERRRFGISVEDQRQWRNLRAARVQWRKLIEAHGVFTYMMPMPSNELSGFSLLREEVAAICVNDNEISEGAKIFTLFHEYCHLLLRQSGISDENDNNRVEKFCNEFAASFLIPKTALAESVAGFEVPYEFSDSDIRRLATRFRVSNRAIALRLEKTGFAPHGFYRRRTAPWDAPSDRKEPDAKPNTKISQIRIRLKKIGRLHARTVLGAVDRRAINSFDASQLIGLKSSSFGKLRASLG
ncbi:MAG TPA: XRE family transcriptional regulator [Silvibacterium sp.]|nr:XRE family transcriptional regulator [Silvibacterium sp.]